LTSLPKTEGQSAGVEGCGGLAHVVAGILHGSYDGPPPAKMVSHFTALAASMATDGARREDPMREIFARLGDKWSMLILHLLRGGALRHSALKKLINLMGADEAISQRVLTLRLRSLERDGLVARMVTPTTPPRVDYSLTPLGLSLLTPVDGLMLWIRNHNEAIRDAQAAFQMSDEDL